MSERKQTTCRPRHRWEGKIKGDLGCGGVDWIELDQDMDIWRARVSTAVKPLVP
jgi:hypothetical protein